MRMYQIQLSSPEHTCEIHQRYDDGRMVRVPTKMRNIELEILDECFLTIATHAQNVPDYLRCINIAAQIQTIPENVTYINLHKMDLENFMNGFKLTAAKRPRNWTRAKNFWGQIVAPQEIEIEETSETPAA